MLRRLFWLCIGIGVGALAPCSQRKFTVSCDCEWWWGSNYGANLSVVAPGTGIPTTCIEGNGDGGVWGTRYVAGFYGTSAATPHVAGLAALIRTVRPGLDATGVRRLIESTADKVGSDPFDQRLANGTWNKYVGYGRINVQRALRRAIWPFDIVVSLRRHLHWLQTAVKAHWAEIEQLEAGGGDPALVGLHHARHMVRENDLLIVDGDPTKDISLLEANGQNLPLIMRKGEIVKNEMT